MQILAGIAVWPRDLRIYGLDFRNLLNNCCTGNPALPNISNILIQASTNDSAADRIREDQELVHAVNCTTKRARHEYSDGSVIDGGVRPRMPLGGRVQRLGTATLPVARRRRRATVIASRSPRWPHTTGLALVRIQGHGGQILSGPSAGSFLTRSETRRGGPARSSGTEPLLSWEEFGKSTSPCPLVTLRARASRLALTRCRRPSLRPEWVSSLPRSERRVNAGPRQRGRGERRCLVNRAGESGASQSLQQTPAGFSRGRSGVALAS